VVLLSFCFFFSSRRRHTRFSRDWSSDVCSSDLATEALNWALFRGAEAKPGGVAGLSIEHAASLQCLERLDAAILPVDGEGIALQIGRASCRERVESPVGGGW